MVFRLSVTLSDSLCTLSTKFVAAKVFFEERKKNKKRVFAIFLSRYWKNSKILFVRVKAPENEIQIKSMTAGPQVTQNKNEKNV